MASFQIKCPNCETEIMMQEEWLGMQMECPACHSQFTVSGNNPPSLPPMVPPNNFGGGNMPYPPVGGNMPYPAPGGNMPYPSPGGRFCTNCGSPVGYQAAVCVRCGCHPDQEKHFCASCGSPVAPTQAVCIRCGMSLNKQYYGPPKSKTTFILLGIFLGGIGAHNFYAGYNNKAIIQLLVSLLTGFIGSIFISIWAIIEVCTVTVDANGQPMV